MEVSVGEFVVLANADVNDSVDAKVLVVDSTVVAVGVLLV